MKATTGHFISSMFMVMVYCAVCFGQTSTPNVLSTGGGYYQGATHSNSWTMGQLEYTTLQGANYIATQGFQQPGGTMLNISGSIVSEFGSPVPTATVSLSGGATESVVADIAGLYKLFAEKGGNYTVTPSKNNDDFKTNGISTLDIILIRRHILNYSLLNSPYKIIAADVNSSNAVTTLDIVLLRRLILGSDTTFNGKLWSFVKSDFVFANPQNPFPYDKVRTYTNLAAIQTAQNFIGVKLGDVNNSWNPNLLKMGAVGEVQFAMEEYQTLPGDEIIVPVRVKDFNAIAGYQFTLTWNPEVIQLLEVVNQSVPGYYGEQSISEGMLTTSWNDGAGASVTLADDAVAFELKFRVTGAIGTMSEIKIGSEFTQSEAYTNSLDLLNIAATNGMVKVGDERNIGANSLSNISLYPNPTDGLIVLEIPSANWRMESLTLKLFDALGRQMNLTPSPSPGGEGSNFSLDLKPLPGNIFFLSITTDTGSRVMKVVKY